MSGEFEGRTAVVVGGGRGIGKAVSLRLARGGAHVIIADADAALAAEVVGTIRTQLDRGADAHLVDATDAGSVGRFFGRVGDEHGRLDILVNVPGRGSDTHFERITENEWDTDFAITLKAPFLCIQAALPVLLRAPRAAVVSVGSINGTQAFGNEAYSAAKAGLVNLHKNLAVRYGGYGIRFNVVAPGTVRTSLWDARLAVEPGVLADVAALYPLGRVGEPEDVAAACAFLASDESGWITGVELPVDGGITAGHSQFLTSTFGPEFFDTTLDMRPRS